MFQANIAVNERSVQPSKLRIAYWMVAWTLRGLGRIDEALVIQLRLEQENAAAGSPDPYVFEELGLLFQAKGDADQAALYAEKQARARSGAK